MRLESFTRSDDYPRAMSVPTASPTPGSTGGDRYGPTHPRETAAVGTALLVLVIVGAVIVGNHFAPYGIDSAWADVMRAIRRAGLTSVAEHIFDPLGRFPLSWLIVALGGVALWRDRRRRAITFLLIGELTSWAMNSLIKAAAGRPRPPDALIEASRSSFPSGHAAFAAVTAVLLVGLLVPAGRRAGPAALAAGLVVGMAWSRTYLLVHWLTDVVGGLCVGLGVGLLTLATMGTAADRTD
jgi:membrane-associated phospholipid phosphatase